ncbi:MAG: hypothetical protein KC423_20470 [Anaerolineales bacterium]|nr:hypothetical protein [Anaerolineales bacterium]
MAKKQFTTPDNLVNNLDDLNATVPRPAATPRRGRKTFVEESIQPSARDIALVTDDRSMAGQYKRKQILIPPAQLNYIRDKAQDLGLSQAALFRWLLDYGLMAIDQGVFPEVEVVEVRGEARKYHWTSQ